MDQFLHCCFIRQVYSIHLILKIPGVSIISILLCSSNNSPLLRSTSILATLPVSSNLMDFVQLSFSSLGWSCSFSLLFSSSMLFYAWILVWVLANLSFIFNFSTTFWIICFYCRSSAFAVNSATFAFSSISLLFVELVSLYIFELVDSCQSLDFF